MRYIRVVALAAAVLGVGGTASAGPIILGGDDLNEHGSQLAGVNQLGWRYIERALGAISSQVTLPAPVGGFTVDIVEFGDNTDPALTAAAGALGLTTVGYQGAAALTQFFADLAAGTVRPRILYSPGNDYGGASIDSTESAVLAANASAINDFVAAGGGLMSHGGANATAYSYLTVLLPGIVMSSQCANPVTLTAAGSSAFSTLTNADVNAGPCHGTFSGDMGGLIPLALDALGRNVIIGGVGGSITEPPPVVPEPAALLLMGPAAFAAYRSRRNRRQN